MITIPELSPLILKYGLNQKHIKYSSCRNTEQCIPLPYVQPDNHCGSCNLRNSMRSRKKLTFFRQYTTSIPIIAYGRTPDKYVMYPGISFFLPNITNGRNLKTIVTATHTAISVTALKSILSIPPKSNKIHCYRCIVRNFQFGNFLPVCSNLSTVFILFPVLRKIS